MASINLDYAELLDVIKIYSDAKRNESASFLAWYLENYYRLDSLEALDSICDQRGDKGVDGIYINENQGTIDIFQSKLVQNSKKTIGDTVLKEFYGTLSQFSDRKSLEKLIKGAGDVEIVHLINRLDLVSKIETYDVRGIFLSNVEIDANGEAYLDTIDNIKFIGRNTLEKTYISDKRSGPVKGKASFDILEVSSSKYIVDKNVQMNVVPVKAKELIKLDGIEDQSLFDLNVRFSLGKTQVNKDIVSSIKNVETHKNFPLFHNGITIICSKVDDTKAGKITIENYFVVNGCQSLTHFYENSASLTDDLRVIAKFVQVDLNSTLSETITSYSNNQNGVKLRDFKSNDKIQIRLLKEFEANYKGIYYYEVKRGQAASSGEVISNENAGLYLIAFDEQEPWTTHRKYQVFDDKYSHIFGRPEVTADRIVMCHEIIKIIEQQIGDIHNKLFGKYVLTKYMLLYFVRKALETDTVGLEAIKEPINFVRSREKRAAFVDCVSKIVSDLIVDINGEVDEYKDDFDYRGKLRDHEWVKNLEKDVIGMYQKSVKREKIPSFAKEWDTKMESLEGKTKPKKAKAV